MIPQVPQPIAHSDYIQAADGHFEILPKLLLLSMSLTYKSTTHRYTILLLTASLTT